MELNDKYKKISDAIEKTIESIPDGAELVVVCGLVLRQVLELHQKVDELLKDKQ